MKKALILLFLFVFVQAGFCEITNEIRYNGRLKGYTVPLGGGTQRKLEFRYYNALTGGTRLNTADEIHYVTPNADGVFSVTLKPDVNWQKEGNVYLQLLIDDRPMQPREKIMSQPYAQHARTADNGVPPGTVIAFAGNKLPAGYLRCNGDPVSKDVYPELYDAIGTTYGGTGNPNFNLPNFQGMFLRGAGSNTVTTTPGGTVTITAAGLGVKQADAIRNISGKTHKLWNGGTSPTGSFGFEHIDDTRPASGSQSGAGLITFDASKTVPTANENRPTNYAVNYYIKY
ncbi:MAG: phage tail protein [Endomicrobia bacterium]|nr:phage tail protein [Endomicrobiia bacterium]